MKFSAKKVSFSFVLLAFVLVVFYQNCSNVKNTNSLNDLSREISGLNGPLLVSEITEFNYTKDANCNFEPFSSPVLLYSQSFYICTWAVDSCQKTFFEDMGFSVAQDAECESPQELNESFVDSLSFEQAEDIGFSADPELVCSMGYEVLINIKKRKCATASNGCKYSFLKDKGYTKDPLKLCNEVEL